MKKILNDRYEHLVEFVDSLPEGGFERGGKVVYDKRNKVKIFEVGGRKVVVKRFRRPSGINRLVYTFLRKTKAARAYRNAGILAGRGIDTPAAIACIETRERGLVGHCYLVTEYTDWKPVRDMEHEEKYIRAMGENKYVDFAVRLHKLGINHKDFTNTNVLYRLNADLTFDFMLIDINRMSFGSMSKWACMKSLKKIAEDSETILRLAGKYAEIRGWNRCYSMGIISLYRGMWEQKRRTKSYIRQLIRSKA